MRRALSRIAIAAGGLAIACLTMMMACAVLCPDNVAKRVSSPDGRYVVTHTYGDYCGGATVAWTHTVRIADRRDFNEGSAVLLETYRSPAAIGIQWKGPRALEIEASGMNGVRELVRYRQQRWKEVSVTIRLSP